jgi:rieske iron-sulfur protein
MSGARCVAAAQFSVCPSGTTKRRDVLTGTAALMLGIASGLPAGPAGAAPAEERPRPGDALVRIDGDDPAALGPKDVAEGTRQILAWPMDPDSRTVRNGSRLNKVLLVRLDPATLVGDTRDRAAEGVLAYSAICPHAGCEVTAWLEDQQILECPCHSSHYNPREAAAVIDGPTMRPLPALPLRIVDGKLVVAKSFTSRPGIIQI